MAVIVALKSLKDRCKVTLYTDSQYIVENIIKGWAKKWRENNWKRNKREKAQNPDLWDELLNLFEKHKVKLNWVRGHAGNAENEKADVLATSAIKKAEFKTDHYYESHVMKSSAS